MTYWYMGLALSISSVLLGGNPASADSIVVDNTVYVGRILFADADTITFDVDCSGQIVEVAADRVDNYLIQPGLDCGEFASVDEDAGGGGAIWEEVFCPLFEQRYAAFSQLPTTIYGIQIARGDSSGARADFYFSEQPVFFTNGLPTVVDGGQANVIPFFGDEIEIETFSIPKNGIGDWVECVPM